MPDVLQLRKDLLLHSGARRHLTGKAAKDNEETIAKLIAQIQQATGDTRNPKTIGESKMNSAQRLLKTLNEATSVTSVIRSLGDLTSGEIMQVAIKCVQEVGGGRSSLDKSKLADAERALKALYKESVWGKSK